MRLLRSPSILRFTALGVAGAFIGVGCLDESMLPNAERRAIPQEARQQAPEKIVNSAPLPAGQYGVQSVNYDDATGSYKMFLLDTPAGAKPMFQSNDVRMARIDDESLTQGKKSYVEFAADGAPTLYLTPDFQIAYTHNVTEEQVDPATGQREVVVVRQETSSWSPFMSAMAGAAIGNMLFAPRYYFPPPYTPGMMSGYGGSGMTQTMASQQYAQRFGSEPQASRISKTGVAPRRASADSIRSTGRGAGASKFSKPSGGGFRKPTRSFGFGRRR